MNKLAPASISNYLFGKRLDETSQQNAALGGSARGGAALGEAHPRFRNINELILNTSGWWLFV